MLVRVIGCGNPDVGDDAAGVVAVERARDALEALGVEVVPQAAPLGIVHLLEGADAVVVVDAIRSPGAGRAPGEIVRAEAGADGLPAEIRSSLSSHGLGVAEAVGLAAAMGPTPRVIVLGVEAERTSAGAGLSDAVRRALPDLVGAIVSEASDLVGGAGAEVERSPAEGPTDPTRDGGAEPR
ncbi:MAG TPA: hydrogenase maturation protease [Actinomycetota bacterium]